MKVSIRNGVFETNSSSVHSLTISKKNEYEEFEAGKLWALQHYHGDVDFLPEAEAIEWNIEHMKKEFKFNDENFFNAYREEKNFYQAWERVYSKTTDDYYDDRYHSFESNLEFNSYEYYVDWDTYWDDNQYETFDKSYTSEHGDELVIWGYYGNDY